VYTIDPGLTRVVSGTLKDDSGRNTENIVFLHLRRKYREIFYYNDEGEYDFIAVKKLKPLK
jgi:predicted AAA+ superfamily ATPase